MQLGASSSHLPSTDNLHESFKLVQPPCGTVFGSMQKLEYILYQTVVRVSVHKHCKHDFASIT